MLSFARSQGGDRIRETEDRREGGARRRRMLLAVVVLVALPVLVTQAGAALSLSNPPSFNFVNDENGADDQPGQKDLSAQAVATPAPGDLWVSWKWDVTAISGGNTGDGCALFDTNSNSKVNFAVCVTIAGSPTAQAATSPRVYTCGDGKVDRCTSTYAQVTPINTACATNTGSSDPFHNGQSDTQAICRVDLADVGGAGTANLINTCSYPSQEPTSAPSDCVLIPRDAFLKITKIASPNAGSFPFRLGLTTDATPPVVFTASGSESSQFIPIRSDRVYKVKEDVPGGWAIDTPAPSCTGASGTGSSNGSFSGDTISGIDASPDNQITCTFRDKQLTGAIRIVKQRAGTTTKLDGAHFSIGGITGDFVTGSDGTVCKDGLPFGSYSVTETQAPNGHNLDTTNPRTVEVSSSGTCASGAASVTFNDQLILGTVNIHKSKGGGGALEGATFTLYTDNGTIGGTRGGDDTATAKTCTTNSSGDCSITGVALGNYWVVETGTPAGYVTAADQTVEVGVGGSPGVGDSESLSFVDAIADGRIEVHKTGFGGADLQGATFTLYVDADPLTASFDPINDTSTSKTCTTGADGKCTITGVAPGRYWLRETTTPAGYDTADPVAVDVPLGSQPNVGATVQVPISDPVVPGTVSIHKTGLNGGDLPGATFTLYVNNSPLAGPRGAEDTATAKTCTTNGAGDCTISGVSPGNYWAVETTTPAGYDTAPDQAVVVDIGAAAHTGDTDSLTFHDPVVPGTVNITKTDDAGNELENAEFTLYTDASPFGGSRGAGDTITDPVKKCTTRDDGTCEITAVTPGKYWVVETVTPAHYETAADRAITVGLGAAAHVGATVPVSIIDRRKDRVVVLVCHEGTDTLYSRDVTVNGVTKQSLAAGSLTGDQQKALCDTGGASFGDIAGQPDVNALIELSKVNGG